MTDDQGESIERRDVLKVIGASSTVGLAGCSGDGGDGGEGEDGEADPTPTPADSTPTPAGSTPTDADSGTETTTGSRVYSAAMSMSTLQLPFFNRMRCRFAGMAEERDDLESVGIFDAQGNNSQQLSDLENALTRGADFLIVNPVSSTGIRSVVEQANEQNVPMINIDRHYVNLEEITTYVGSNNFDLGRRSTKLLLDLMESKHGEKDQYNVVQLQGIPGTSAATGRTQGFEAAVESSGKINVLDTLVGDFSVSGAVGPTEDAVTRHGDEIDGIFAQNDPMARGAVQVLSDEDMADMPISGVDGGQEWVSMITENEYYGTLAQQPVEMVNLSVQYGIAAANGEDVPNVDHTGGVEVTMDNAQEFLDNHFQYTSC